MSGVEALSAVASASRAALDTPAPTAPGAAPPVEFASLLSAGLRHVESKVETANGLVKQFAIDETVPLHQVTIALEEARIAVDLAVQIRSRLVESYREIMNMQL